MVRKLLFAISSFSILITRVLGSDEGVMVPANVSHEAWDILLKKYVNDRGLIAYADWKKRPDGSFKFGSKTVSEYE